MSEVTWHGRQNPPPKMRHRTSLTFGQMRCRVRLTFNQMYSPLGWDLGSGWHLVRWLVGWPIAAGRLADWLVSHLIKWHLVRCTSPRWDVGPVWHLVRCTPPKVISVKWSKNVWRTLNYITPQNLNKSIFKWLRAIWNLCFPIICIQIWNFGGLYIS